MTNKPMSKEELQCLVNGVIEKTKSELKDLLSVYDQRNNAPEPIKDLRWLVERHECLNSVLRYQWNSPWPWAWKSSDPTDSETQLMEAKAMTVVRGIVKAMCCRCVNGSTVDWGQCSKTGKWHMAHKYGDLNDTIGVFDTELEAIDALLTAMQSN